MKGEKEAMTTKHTPLPWKVEEKGNEPLYSVEGNGTIIALCGTGRDDAYFIERAINNFYPLLEALKAFLNGDASVSHMIVAYGEARLAVAKAEEKWGKEAND